MGVDVGVVIVGDAVELPSDAGEEGEPKPPVGEAEEVISVGN